VSGTIHLVEKEEAKAKGPSSGHMCDICRKEIYRSTERFRCLTCEDFDVCASCFPALVHATHGFVRIPPSGEIEVVFHSMPHSICDGCGTGIGGVMHTCAECDGSAFTCCHLCMPRRYQLHPGHRDRWIRCSSFQFPAAYHQLACRGCGCFVRDSLWRCDHCYDMAVCTSCYPMMMNHAHGHFRFSNISRLPQSST